MRSEVASGPIHDPFVTVVVPVYDEAACIAECVRSLRAQDFRPLELLVVDDGSVDESVRLCEDLGVKVLTQDHRGPGAARNLGARHALGNILVFVDADMVLAPDYVSRLVVPLVAGEAIATSHWDELVLDWENPWARCQTYYLGLPERRRQPVDPPAGEHVYRAVRKDFLLAAGGMDEHAGRGDDSSVARRTGVLARIVRGAICYHKGPASLAEIYRDAVWAGKNVAVERRRRLVRCARSLLATNPLASVAKLWRTALTKGEPRLLLYAVVHTTGFDIGVLSGLVTRNYLK